MDAEGINDLAASDAQRLLDMLVDADRNLRLAAVLSLPPAFVGLAAFDRDPAVRFAVVERIAETELAPFLDDRESVIRELACSRLTMAAERHINAIMGEPPSVMTVEDFEELVP